MPKDLRAIKILIRIQAKQTRGGGMSETSEGEVKTNGEQPVWLRPESA